MSMAVYALGHQQPYYVEYGYFFSFLLVPFYELQGVIVDEWCEIHEY